MPNVATVSESGLPGFEATVWYAFLAPTGTPADIIGKLNAGVNTYIKSDKAAALFDGSASRGRRHARRPEGVHRGEMEKWAAVVKRGQHRVLKRLGRSARVDRHAPIQSSRASAWCCEVP